MEIPATSARPLSSTSTAGPPRGFFVSSAQPLVTFMAPHRNRIERRSSLSWEARPARELALLSWPIAVSMISYSVMTLADTLFVARLGPSSLAGVGLGGTAAFMVLCFAFGTLRGVKVLISQARGAGGTQRELATIGAGIWLALAAGFVCLVVGEGVALLLPALSASAAAGESARTYLAVRALAAPVVLVFVALREARYGRGDSRTPMVAGVVANLTNISLDALFLLVLDMGVAGAAAATVIAHVVEAGVLVVAQARHGFGLRAARARDVRSLLSVGLPTGLQFFLELGAFAMLTAILARISDVELAAHQIALQVIHFAFLPAVAVAEAASVLTGQAVGARRMRLVNVVAHRALLLTVAWGALCTLVLVVLGDVMARSFTTDAVLIARTADLLLVAALFPIVDGAGVVGRGALRGAGDVRWPAAVGVVAAWAMTPLSTWVLGMWLGMGARGAWLGLCGEILVASALFWLRLEGGGWWRPARRTRRLSLA